MASTKQKQRSLRTLIILAVLIFVAFGSLLAGTKWSDASLAPNLALDLEGGTQVILTPIATDGSKIKDEDIVEAIKIIRQRVDSSGVAEAEISSQGGQNIVVGLPGSPSQETLELVRRSAQMNFRPVLEVRSVYEDLQNMSEDELKDFLGEDAEGAGEGSEEGAEPTDGASEQPSSDTSGEPSDDASATPSDESTTSEGAASATDARISTVANIKKDGGDATPSDEPATDEAGEPNESAPAEDATTGAPAAGEDAKDPSDLGQITDAVRKEFDELNCLKEESLAGGRSGDPSKPLVTCQDDGSSKFILGPVEIPGTDISRATSGLNPSNQWVVNIEFNGEGAKKFAATTSRLGSLAGPYASGANVAPNLFAMVLDGLVISAPSVRDTIPNGQAEISGSFNKESAERLASQLNFGALPLSFEVQSEQEISATLGSEQLQKGLIAGAIGLLLVVIYSLFQYRVLGLVTVASLVIAAIITYLAISLLSWTQGFRLSLPGVAGVIVAIGITADSFIVYFERIRDELRDGRTLSAAIDKGWDRAKRTILASDTVNFLAAIVLYFLAVGGVRGFAFTLGLTTIVDLVVVFWFTHPLLKLVSRTKFFIEGHSWSGLDPRRLGVRSARYAGRGRVVTRGVESGAADDEHVEIEHDDAAGLGSGEMEPGVERRRRERQPAVPVGGPTHDESGRRLSIAERRAAMARSTENEASATDAEPGTEGETH